MSQIKIVWKRICLIKEKRENWKILPSDNFKSWKEAFLKGFYSMFYLFVLWKSVLVVTSVFMCLNVKDVIFRGHQLVSDQKFEVQIWNFISLPRYLILKRKFNLCFPKKRVNLKIFRQVCFNDQSSFVWESSVLNCFVWGVS